MNTKTSAGAARAAERICGGYVTLSDQWMARSEQEIAEIIDQETGAARLADALEGMINANSGVAVMPTTEARNQNAALKEARAALAARKSGN